MAPQIKPVLGFKTQSDRQIATTASAVIKEMTGNPAFPNPTVDLKAVQAAVDELNAALAAQVQGGTAATAVKKNKREKHVHVAGVSHKEAWRLVFLRASLWPFFLVTSFLPDLSPLRSYRYPDPVR